MSVEKSLQRKQDHIDLCHTGDVGLVGDMGLFSDVRMIHQALPELAMSDIQLDTAFLDHSLKMPLMLTGMTGGPERAGEINRSLAKLCQDNGMAFGLGSQRIMTADDSTIDTFQVRQVAPDVCLLGNLGVNQVRDLGVDVTRQLFERTEADYMAIHLNPAMELIQPGAEADSDFSYGFDTIARAVDALDGKVVVKECGCGLSPSLVSRLVSLGVKAVDVSGVGGTSWVKLEALRAMGEQAELGLDFQDWGIPTAASTWGAAQVDGVMVIASGGIYSGRTAAKAFALGADVAGFARPILQAYLDGGVDAAQSFVDGVARALKTAMALTGSKNLAMLRSTTLWIGPRLSQWQQCLRHEVVRNG